MGVFKKFVRRALYESFYFLQWLLKYAIRPKTTTYDNAGKNVVVVGNGPSAKAFPFAAMIEKGYDLCCVNDFLFSEELFFKYKPRFYCCIDPIYSAKDYPESEAGKRFLGIMERVDWDMTFICFKHQPIVINNPNITVHYLNNNNYKGDFTKFRYSLFRKNIATAGFQNVIVAATFYFVMSNAESILLTGVESDWHKELIVAEDNDVYREYIHFYGVERINVTKDGQIGKGELYKYFYFYYQTLLHFHNLSKFALAHHSCVYNTCMNSYIDVFPKKKVEEFINN